MEPKKKEPTPGAPHDAIRSVEQPDTSASPTLASFNIRTPREASLVDRTGRTSPDQIRLAGDRGELPVYLMPNRNRLYLLEDLLRWCEYRRTGVRGEPIAVEFAPTLKGFLILSPLCAARVDETRATSADQIRLAGDRGELPVYRTPTGVRLYLREDVVRWLASEQSRRQHR